MKFELTRKEAEVLYGILAYGRIDVDRILVGVENKLRAEIETGRHTEKCKATRLAEKKAFALYEQRWPHYCRKCDGEGGHTDYEYRGECHGVQASEQVFNYCPHCVEQGICPRCGSISNNFEDDDVEQLHCATCDWREGDVGCPEITDDCGCYEDSLDVVM